MKEKILVTGATGLIGGGVLERMLDADTSLEAYVLVRDEGRWNREFHRWGHNGASARLALDHRTAGRTVHLCSGKRALTLGELLDVAYDTWERDAEWRKRKLARAIITDLATYRMFERAVMETGDPRLRALISSLSHFVPQMALPKCFDTAVADELLDFVPPPPSTYWGRMLTNLIATGWGAADEAAA
jgi:hypothetical protein